MVLLGGTSSGFIVAFVSETKNSMAQAERPVKRADRLGLPTLVSRSSPSFGLSEENFWGPNGQIGAPDYFSTGPAVSACTAQGASVSGPSSLRNRRCNASRCGSAYSRYCTLPSDVRRGGRGSPEGLRISVRGPSGCAIMWSFSETKRNRHPTGAAAPGSRWSPESSRGREVHEIGLTAEARRAGIR